MRVISFDTGENNSHIKHLDVRSVFSSVPRPPPHERMSTVPPHRGQVDQPQGQSSKADIDRATIPCRTAASPDTCTDRYTDR